MTLLIEIARYDRGESHTAGVLSIDGKFQCFTMEDAIRPEKLPGETAIPPGEYAVVLRSEGGMFESYTRKFGDAFKGMMWLLGVPGFEWIYIHIGNTAKDSEGCILVGQTMDCINPEFMGRSTKAFVDLNEIVTKAIDRGEQVVCKIV